MPSNGLEKATVARNLRHQRRRKGLTQEQLSESSGVAIRTIQRIENAKVEPHLQTLVLLADTLDLEVHELSAMTSTEDASQGCVADRKWLLLLHLSPIVGFIIPFANLIVPLILWAYKQDDHPLYNEHGRAVVNFHLTVTLVFMAGVALLLVLFQVGLLLIMLTSAYALALILLNARRVMKDENYSYPLSLAIMSPK
jgi:serine-type D-Ala-D-Ala carboxypeptidase/endopeptidase